jgi:hypothetical protein
VVLEPVQGVHHRDTLEEGSGLRRKRGWGGDLGGVVAGSELGRHWNDQCLGEEALAASVDGTVRHEDVVVSEDDVLIVQVLGDPVTG